MINWINENKPCITFYLVLFVAIVAAYDHVKYATALESCNASIEKYRSSPPQLDVGEGGYDNWKSSLVPND